MTERLTQGKFVPALSTRRRSTSAGFCAGNRICVKTEKEPLSNMKKPLIYLSLAVLAALLRSDRKKAG
jgi:hypothetical protein